MSVVTDYFATVKAKLDEFLSRINNVGGPVGTVPVKASNSIPFSFKHVALINDEATVIETSTELDDAKALRGDRERYAIFERATGIIYHYTDTEWRTTTRVFLDQYFPSGVFYYNPTTRRLYWAEPNASIFLIGGGR